MFDTEIYIERRARLKAKLSSGVLLFLGNNDSPMNYKDNTYPFSQDSSFLYYWGLDTPGLAAIIDIDEGKEVLFGHNPTLDEIVWTGPQPAFSERGAAVGVTTTMSPEKLFDEISLGIRSGRRVHFLPQYRADNMMKLEELLGIRASQVNKYTSGEFTKAVITQRSVKSEEEVAEVEAALDVSYEMHTQAMRLAKPGVYERDVAGAVEGIAISGGGRLAFPVIFSVQGEVLHNHYYGNLMKDGDIAVHDSGAASLKHYASDITRTIPIGGRFTSRQKEIYQMVLDAQVKSIEAIKPGFKNVEVYNLSAKIMMEGLKSLGLMKGDVDEAVAAGAHAIFFQCGVGHMVGLDVHDMEGLGEELVGYDATVKRSSLFGKCYLRLGKALEPGYLICVEPGIYFIPPQIDLWRAEKRFEQYINYDQFEQYKDFGGIRIEDDVFVTEEGNRVLGKPIPKTIAEVEDWSS